MTRCWRSSTCSSASSASELAQNDSSSHIEHALNDLLAKLAVQRKLTIASVPFRAISRSV